MLLDKNFNNKPAEERWSKLWDERGWFSAGSDTSKKPFTLVMPPPNVTGSLHMGHALVSTLQDIICRWKRMSGYDVCWVPGVDHAGIATQARVERWLLQSEGLRRQELGRERFLERIWEWKQLYGDQITEQLRLIGCSCDWQRERFTLDEGCSKAVAEAFKRLFDRGLIYRGNYLVNWDPVTQTALSDDEVEYVDREGFLWTVAYPLEDGSGEILVATSRPETILADVAIAVHPEDPRLSKLIGKCALLPLMGRVLPIIGDVRVDPAFGTGAVKITPAHDPLDWEIGRDHGLPVISMMSAAGKVAEGYEPFTGQSMEQARAAVVERLEQLGLLRAREAVQRRVGVSYRSKATIEPFVSKQWFVRLSAFKQRLREMVEHGEVELIPKGWEATYYHWIDNLRDWCISRQLWWGHRIPVWYHVDDPERTICWSGHGMPEEVLRDPDQWQQDDDVLDTWFSSALWPFSVFGWPEQSTDLQRYYPNSLLVTGWDILYFWVARMMMAADAMTGRAPFPKVFLHGLIYGRSYWRKDAEGRSIYVADEERKRYDLGEPIPSDVYSRWEKMSKSLGNVIDPREVIDEYGTDAVRMALIATNPQARQIDLDRRRFQESRNFVNKLWNGTRFVLMHICGERPLDVAALAHVSIAGSQALEDRWILSRLDMAIDEASQALEDFSFDRLAQVVSRFFWDDFCSYYLELSKPALQGDGEQRLIKQGILLHVIEHVLRLLHPIVPFITEELYQQLKVMLGAELPTYSDARLEVSRLALLSEACAVASYPRRLGATDQAAETEFAIVQRAVHALRNLRGEMRIAASQSIDATIVGSADDMLMQTLKPQLHLVRSLVKVANLNTAERAPEAAFKAVAPIGNLEVVVILPQELHEQERKRLMKEQSRLEGVITRSPCSNPEFCKRAPANLVAEHQQQLAIWQAELTAVREQLSKL